MAVTSPYCVNCVKTRRFNRRGSGSRSFAAFVAFSVLSFGIPAVSAAYETGRAEFSVQVNDDLVIPYRVFAIYVLPSERISLSASATDARADSGALLSAGPGQWQWTAPEGAGVAELRFSNGSDEVRINAVIMHPAEQVVDGRLNGYRIDSYPESLNGEPVYTAPDGFIELTSELIDLELSPHFRLGQFPSKQSTALPKYLLLRESLLLKLELLLERLNEVGIEADSFTVMSGYRTPMYNRAIGNGQHSRHIYGGAADIYVDVSPRDDVMDDLNGDGRFDYRDAQWLYGLADELFGLPEYGEFRGGLGVYRRNSVHGPFLHVDARGRRARWGLIP